jgi:hypothetical protein
MSKVKVQIRVEELTYHTEMFLRGVIMSFKKAYGEKVPVAFERDQPPFSIATICSEDQLAKLVEALEMMNCNVLAVDRKPDDWEIKEPPAEPCPCKFQLIEGKEKEWEKAVTENPDPYGAAVVHFANDWAEAIEGSLTKDTRLEDVAEKCVSMARSQKYGSVTGMQYGMAVSMLAYFWKRGEELRRWHNLHTQRNQEGEEANEKGGTLNPAMFRIG